MGSRYLTSDENRMDDREEIAFNVEDFFDGNSNRKQIIVFVSITP